MQPRRSGAKNKHQAAEKQTYDDEVERAHVNRDRSRGRTSRDAL